MAGVDDWTVVIQNMMKAREIFEENGEDPEQGGEEAARVRIFIQIRHPVSVSLRDLDVGGYPPHGTGPGGFPRPGGAVTDGEDAMVEVGRKLGVHLGGGGKRGGGVRAGGNLHLVKVEYGHAVYCNATNSGPVLGGGKEAGGMGRYEVVGTGGT